MEDKLYQNKFAAKAAVGLISALNKVNRHKEEEEKRMAEDKAKWVETEEYVKLQKELQKGEEEDGMRIDSDPKGFDTYETIVRKDLIYL